MAKNNKTCFFYLYDKTWVFDQSKRAQGPIYIRELKVTANLFGLEFCKILKSYHKIAHYIYFVLKKKLFENVFFLRSYCKFCVLHD